ncbi:hypothetical protein ACELLULO517_05990 [Acidisoma cellulosilytica]|uniref:Calcium-binding protein n=1 Tax=Acidisoma cellulosilyticum TaxID=2802395 RepID=A0A963Z0J1_9PROT|nr:hypothetical protein [Acidisoma cellulosilyticum]MCB8879777.1 hypothetical protein [Acidisoma cellulosilyticum]
MSDTATIPSGVQPANYSSATGSSQIFEANFGPGTIYSVVIDSSVNTVPGALVVGGTGTSQTISGASIVSDSNATGNNAFTVTSPTVVLAAPSDTITAATAATTVYGGWAGITQFSLGGSGSSVTGGPGDITGVSTGANTTLIGGGGNSIFTVTGANSLAVAGASGITGIDASSSTGPLTIATNPLANSGTLVATLGSGADTFIGGAGASTVTAGSGNDVFGFVNGHAGGTVVIIGFNASDNIAFGGYGYTGTNLPVETVTAAGDVMTLNDGTKILFAGLDHKLFNN